MSDRALMAQPPQFEEIPEEYLIESDGVPMDSNWQRLAMQLLIDSVTYRFDDRDDFFTSGDMFVYYNPEQARNKDFRGPDFFFVWNTTRLPNRQFWYVWKENRTPNLVVEFNSPTTKSEDYGVKKDIYEQILQVRDYFCFDPFNDVLDGWRLHGREYASLPPNEKGWLWCEELQLWFGRWHGKVEGYEGIYPRFFDQAGNLVLTRAEAAELEAEAAKFAVQAAKLEAYEAKQKEDTAKLNAAQQLARAETAESENALLREQLAKLQKAVPNPPAGENGKN